MAQSGELQFFTWLLVGKESGEQARLERIVTVTEKLAGSDGAEWQNLAITDTSGSAISSIRSDHVPRDAVIKKWWHRWGGHAN